MKNLVLIFAIIISMIEINAQDTINLGNSFKRIENKLICPNDSIYYMYGMEKVGTSKIEEGLFKKTEKIYVWTTDEFSREYNTFEIYIWNPEENRPDQLLPYASVYNLPDSITISEIISIGDEIVFEGEINSDAYICTAELVKNEEGVARWRVTKSVLEERYRRINLWK